MIQQTSLSAYWDVQTKLGKRQEAVLRMLEAHGPMCNQLIAEALKWPINTVTPRIKELREKGKVEIDRKGIYYPTNKTVIYWRIKNGS